MAIQEKKGMLGAAVIIPQPNVTKITEEQIDQEDNKGGDCPDVYPIKINENEVFNKVQCIFRCVRIQDRDYGDQ